MSHRIANITEWCYCTCPEMPRWVEMLQAHYTLATKECTLQYKKKGYVLYQKSITELDASGRVRKSERQLFNQGLQVEIRYDNAYDSHCRLAESSFSIRQNSMEVSLSNMVLSGVSHLKMEYNEQGDVVLLEADGKTYRFVYKYDARGNWVRCERYVGKNCQCIRVRKMEYAEAGVWTTESDYQNEDVPDDEPDNVPDEICEEPSDLNDEMESSELEEEAEEEQIQDDELEKETETFDEADEEAFDGNAIVTTDGEIIVVDDEPEKTEESEELQVGDDVCHKTYGVGKVVEFIHRDDGCTFVKVKFKVGIGEKRFFYPDSFDKGYLWK